MADIEEREKEQEQSPVDKALEPTPEQKAQ